MFILFKNSRAKLQILFGFSKKKSDFVIFLPKSIDFQQENG